MFPVSRFILMSSLVFGCLFAEETPQLTQEAHHYTPPSFDKITPFTGKVTKNRVRTRLEPNLEGAILKELEKGDYVVVAGEIDDFYAIKPPTDFKGYIYRTYVSNDLVEGNYVNIRLAPTLEGEIVAQASTGDHLLNAKLSPLDNKWLEFDLPESTYFFVSKNLIDRVGDEDFITEQQKREQQSSDLLETTYLISQNEMQKPFEEINLSKVFQNFNIVIQNYSDFPDQVKHARELINKIQENYIDKKIAFLEAKTDSVTDEWEIKNSQLTAEIETQKRRLSELEEQLAAVETPAPKSTPAEAEPLHPQLTEEPFAWEDRGNPVNSKLTLWLPAEQDQYGLWKSQFGNYSMNEFYSHQYRNNSIALRGTIEPYRRSVKNKPGDYLLLSPATRHPIAYLYSTQIDLEHFSGHEVTVVGLPRPNNHFAFPAYFVVSVE